MHALPPLPLATFGPLDWGILAVYLLGMIGIGLWHFRRNESSSDFFLAERSMPTWALVISIVGSSLSAVTFVGAPDFAYQKNLTYMMNFFTGFIGVFIVGYLFVPKLYRAGTVTIYGFLAGRFGEGARVAVACTFLLGRFLASGSRLFFAAIPLVLLIFGSDDPTAHKGQLLFCVLLVGAVGTFYTVLGGIRAVIWIDLIQFLIVVGAALLSIGLLLNKIPLSPGEIWATLAATPAPGGTSKVTILNTEFNWAEPFTLWAALFGATFLSVASLGVDQDLAQRFLVARSPARGAITVIGSQFLSVITVSLFMAIGLLLFVFYKRPDVMGAAAPDYSPGQNAAVYTQFLLKELPPVLSGLAIAGLFAAAQGSMDSAINAMASSAVDDVYFPLRRARGLGVDARTDAVAPKWAVALIGLVMTGFAVACAFVYDPKTRTFLDFALGVMTFAFSGMLGVFCCALFTRRGNSASVAAALVTGFAAVTTMQDGVLGRIGMALAGEPWKLAWPWWMPIGTTLSFSVCCLGNPGSTPPRRAAEPLR